MQSAKDATSGVPDDVLLMAYAKGDSDAARELTRRLLPRVLGFASRFLGDPAEAEDVAQEAMLKLWKIAPVWRQGEAKVSTWLYRVVANLCIDRQRRGGRMVGIDTAPEPVDTTPGAPERVQAAQRAAALTAALAGLPDRQRQAVVLRHLEGLDNPDIAQAMDISVEAVESLVARGKRALAARLAGRRAELGYSDD